MILSWRAGGDDVGDAVLDGHFGHGAGDFEGFRPVIQARKDVAMNIDHAKAG